VNILLKDMTMGISVCRNEKLANVFYRLELIEAYGTGILKIMDAYEGIGKYSKNLLFGRWEICFRTKVCSYYYPLYDFWQKVT